MAKKPNPLHDHPRSMQSWKRGDTRMFDGEAWESDGHIDEQSEEDLKKPATRIEDKHFWRKKKKPAPEPDAVPTS